MLMATSLDILMRVVITAAHPSRLGFLLRVITTDIIRRFLLYLPLFLSARLLVLQILCRMGLIKLTVQVVLHVTLATTVTRTILVLR